MSPEPALAESLLNWIDLLMRHSMPDLLHFARQHDLSMSQLGALFHIQHSGSSGVSGLGVDLGVTSAGASQMLERLVQQELVTRTEDPHDRRLRRIVLTDKGRQLLQASVRARQRWLAALINDLTPAESAQVAATLALLLARAHQSEPPYPADLRKTDIPL